MTPSHVVPFEELKSYHELLKISKFRPQIKVNKRSLAPGFEDADWSTFAGNLRAWWTRVMLPSFIWRVGKPDSPLVGSPDKGRGGASYSISKANNGRPSHQPQHHHQDQQRPQQHCPHHTQQPQQLLFRPSPQQNVKHQVQSTSANAANDLGPEASSHSDRRIEVHIKGESLKEAILARCLKSMSGKAHLHERKLLMQRFSSGARLGDVSFVLSAAPHDQAKEAAHAITEAVAEAVSVILADDSYGWSLPRESSHTSQSFPSQSSPYTSQHSSVSADSSDQTAAAHSHAEATATPGNVGRFGSDFAATNRAAAAVRTVSLDSAKAPKVLKTRIPTAKEDLSQSAKTPTRWTASAKELPVTTVLLPVYPYLSYLSACVFFTLLYHGLASILHVF
jgi:hypothetical protein